MRVLLMRTRASAVRPAKARTLRSSTDTILRMVRGSCSLDCLGDDDGLERYWFWGYVVNYKFMDSIISTQPHHNTSQ